jgi:lysyl-tRNA synthetase, class II
MVSRPRMLLAATTRAVMLATAIILITTLTTGLLYWVRAVVAHWPGPMVRDVLPLDELAIHDSVPLIVSIAAFGLAGAALGLVTRALRLSRLAAGLSLAIGVGGWLYVVDAVSLFVVRQEPFSATERIAAGLQPVYLAAVLAGAGGALLGHGRPRARPVGTARLLALMVAAGGLVDLISALVPRPGWALGAVERFGPGLVHPAAHALVVPVGALLLIASRGLARGNRRAWQLSIALLAISAVLHLLRGPDYLAAIITALMAVALLARRQDFPFSGDPGARPSAIVRLVGMLALAVGYGLIAIFVYRTAAGVSFRLSDAWSDTVRALVGMRPVREAYLGHDFSRWFPFSVLSIAAIGLIWAADVWLRPWRQRIFPDAGRRERATQIVRQWGDDTLAPFALRADKDWFIKGQTLVAFRVVRDVAVVSGDPIGPPDEAAQVLAEFLTHARAHGWHVAVLGASDRLLQVYRSTGLHPVYHGDEAIIDIASFSLDGRPMRASRQAVHRLERSGYRTEAMWAANLPPSVRAELAALDEDWLRGQVRKGFTMELDSLFRLGGTDAAFLIGRDADGHLAGCLHMAVCAPSRSLSLSSMPRRPGTPNGFSAWLIVNAVAWARHNGFEHLSLNFAPFADLLSGETPTSSAQRLKRGALLKLKHALALQLDNLVRFDKQFSPRWQSRYVVVEHRTDLPRVAFAAMAAEGYLPHADLVRGPGWTPGGRKPEAAAQGAADEPVTEPTATVPGQKPPAGASAVAGPPAAAAGRSASAKPGGR